MECGQAWASMIWLLTWLPDAQVEVVGHRGAGVGGDWPIAMILCPLDQCLGPRGQVVLGCFGHLHLSLCAWAETNGIWCLKVKKCVNVSHVNMLIEARQSSEFSVFVFHQQSYRIPMTENAALVSSLDAIRDSEVSPLQKQKSVSFSYQVSRIYQ